MEAPLFSDYKRSFIGRRLLETFLGGLRIYFPTKEPYYVYILQIVLFAVVPFVIGAFLYFLKIEALEAYQVSLAGGFCIFIYAITIQLISVYLQKQSLSKDVTEEAETIGDEEIYLFDCAFGPRTWQFLFPSKKSILSFIIHSSVAGLVTGLSISFLNPAYEKQFRLSDDVISTVAIFGILSVSIGVWPLFVGCPPEPAVFHQLPFGLQALSRSSHLLTCIFIHILSYLYPGVIWLFYANCLAHLVFVCCPLLWLIGALPPIDAYILWVLEQWLVVVLGGSPTASNEKLIVQNFLGTLTILLVSRLQGFSSFAVMLSVRGFFLSLDIDYLLMSLRKNGQVHSISKIPTYAMLDSTFNRKKTAIKELIFVFVLLIGVIILSLGVHLSHQDWYNNATNQTIDRLDMPQVHQPLTILWITLLILAFVLVIIQSIHKPFIFLIFRNPLYFYVSGSKFCADTLPTICQLIHLGGPFASLLFLHILMVQNANGLRTNFSYLDNLIESIPYGFILRQIWQFPEQNLVIMISFYTLHRIFEPLENFLPDISFAGKLQLYTLIILWLNGTLKRLRTIFVFSFSSVSEVKQRKLVNYFLVGWNIATVLFLLAMSCFSSILSIPLFPLFTLPLFLLGFPRPLRFWSYPVGYSANNCSDTIYYEQLGPSVARSVHYAAVSGKLGIIQPGKFFLLRYEDRFFWIQILECGFVYFTYSFKGLELQETSCHTAEASRVDSIFSRAFDLKTGYQCLNNFPLHCLTPLTRISTIGYSDSRNVLTGVIDSPDTLMVIKEYFFKSLLFFLLDHALKTYEKENMTLTRSHSITSRIGSADLKTRKVFSSLPKVERTNRSSRISVYTPKSNLNTSTSKANDNNSTPSHKSIINEVTSKANLQDINSIKSQSGRGSRMAWVADSVIDKAKQKVTADDMLGSLNSDKNETILRPMSWDEKDYHTDEHKENDSRVSSQKESRKKVNSGHSIPFSSKAKSYVTSVDNEDISEEYLVHNIVPMKFDDSSTDTETENFYINNILGDMEMRQQGESTTVVKIKSKAISKDSNSKKSFKPQLKNHFTLALTPPFSWISDIPYEDELLEELQDSFPLSWFKFLLKHFALLKLQRQKNPEKILEKHKKLLDKFLNEDSIEESYRTLVALCQIVLFGSETAMITSNQVLKLFLGDIETSPGFRWLKNKDTLFEIVLHSYRIAVKLSLDHTLVGPTNNSWAELLASLEEYDSEWYVGPDPDDEPKNNIPNIDVVGNKPLTWNDAVRQEVSSLFSIGYNDVKGVYTSHLLTLGTANINMGVLDRETVRAIWASLSGELLYLTNDDDERYSIQAHPVILRNLTVQAADPPLGYPIYSSPPVRMGLPWLYSQ